MRISGILARGRPLALLFLVVLLTAVPLLAEETTYLQVHQVLVPQEIYVGGAGTPDQAVLDLMLEGVGSTGRFPIDCMFVIDVSATANLAEAKRFAFDLISIFSPQDQVGLVSFATTARLDVPLSGDRFAMKTTLSDLVTGGKSAFGDALQLARQELIANGRRDAILVEILLTDGQNNTGRDPQGEAEVAKEAGIKIVSVGIGNLINRGLLEEFAATTGGDFFKRPADTTVGQIEKLVSVTTAAHSIWITKVLPPELRYLGASPAPTQIQEKPDGTTSLIWSIGDLALGASWQTSVTIGATKKGTWETDLGSTVEFHDFRGLANQVLLSGRLLSVIAPPAPPASPTAAFEYDPALPSTMAAVSFTDRSDDLDGEVTVWAWDFGDGETSTEQNPAHSYSHSGTYSVTLMVTDDDEYTSEAVIQEITLRNTEPIVLFDAVPDRPRVAVEAVFDASKSYDADGKIVSYAWDFDGDGLFDLTTASSEAMHTFLEAGEVTVTLVVTDDEGGIASIQKTVEILSSIDATRTIETCLPGDETITNAIVNVTITIDSNTDVHGLTLHEEVPDGWIFTAVDSSSATFRKDTNDWLFLETLRDGDTRIIRYTLTAPATCPNSEAVTVSLKGLVQSSSPRLSRMVLGDDKVLLSPTLPVEVVISRWESENGRIDLCLPEQVAFDQIQYAISLWLSGGTVPYTGDQTINLDIIRDLIAYWLTDTSVHDPLP